MDISTPTVWPSGRLAVSPLRRCANARHARSACLRDTNHTSLPESP